MLPSASKMIRISVSSCGAVKLSSSASWAVLRLALWRRASTNTAAAAASASTSTTATTIPPALESEPLAFRGASSLVRLVVLPGCAPAVRLSRVGANARVVGASAPAAKGEAVVDKAVVDKVEEVAADVKSSVVVVVMVVVVMAVAASLVAAAVVVCVAAGADAVAAAVDGAVTHVKVLLVPPHAPLRCCPAMQVRFAHTVHVPGNVAVAFAR